MGWSWRAVGAGILFGLLAACGGNEVDPVPAASVCSGDGGSGWCWLQPSTPPRQWADFHFIDEKTGWASGESGAMIATADGGKTWQWQATPLREELSLVRFADADRGWAYAYRSSKVLATIDGGRHWEVVGEIPLGMQYRNQVRSVENFWVSTNGVLVASSSGWGSAVSEDGGRNWRVLNIRYVTSMGRSGALWSSFPSEGLWVSRDGGRTASLSLDCSSSCGIVATELADDRQLVVVTFHYDRYPTTTLKRHTSTDGGRSWQSKPLVGPEADSGGMLLVQAAFPYPLTNLDSGRGWGQVRHYVPVETEWGYDMGTMMTSIWHTADSGMTWRQTSALPVEIAITTDARPLDGRSLWLTSAGRSFTTHDAGLSWRELRIPGESAVPHGMRSASDKLLASFDDRMRWHISTDRGSTWTALPGGQPDATRNGFSALWFSDAANGRAIQWDAIVTTSDGGRSWTRQYVRSGQDANRFADFGPDGMLWLSTANGLQRSPDGGRTWQRVALPSAATHAGWVQFVDARNGWVTAFPCEEYDCPSTLYRTRDGGATWQALGPEQTLVGFADPMTGIRLNYDAMERTVDGGATWTAVPVDPRSVNFARWIYFRSSREGWLLGEGAVSKTTDGGATWSSRQTLPRGFNAAAIRFADAQHGWIVGNLGSVLSTVDGGATWQQQDSHTEHQLSSVFALDADHVWIGGHGALLTTRTGGWSR